MDTLRHVRGGMLLDEAAQALANVVMAVESTGKDGELTIKLKVKRLSRSGAIEIIDTLTHKAPQEERLTTMFYPTPEGNLLTQDPRQQHLDLHSVEIPGAANAIAVPPRQAIGE
ncbi:hypothetical protein FOZ76_14610 [Verticiella sediminum]|uniref:Uncharacterized protein n=1 Tax=Verticiella sediminum TaxID=1247510 RepID=A0A556AIE6_9BURK|nr:hypothetical protein [Verticiella sediminum]TSH92649.1 hypothetical protein FOZ76_14610 [Verticiella sediminum]